MHARNRPVHRGTLKRTATIRRQPAGPGLPALFLLVCLLALTGCTNLIFQPTSVRYSDPAGHGIELEDLQIGTTDGVMLHGWHLPAQGAVRGSILFLHGNGANISSHIGGVYWLPAYGYEVFMFDYRGYGRSTGTAELAGVMQDAARMIAYARDHLSSDSKSLTVLGHSMGGSIAIYALSQLPDRDGINALVSVDAFADYRQITRDALSGHWLAWAFQWPLSLTISNQYRPADYIGTLSPLPVFILHSEEDEIIPPAHAEMLFQAAGPPRYRFDLQGTHNQVLGLEWNRELLLEILEGLSRPPGRSAGQLCGGAPPALRYDRTSKQATAILISITCGAARCSDCTTVQDNASLIPSKITQADSGRIARSS